MSDWRSVSIYDAEFSTRVANCCKNEGIENLGMLADKSDGDLLHIPNFGRRSLQEVHDVIYDHRRHEANRAIQSRVAEIRAIEYQWEDKHDWRLQVRFEGEVEWVFVPVITIIGEPPDV